MNADSNKKHGLKEKIEEIGLTASVQDTTMKDHEKTARSKVSNTRKGAMKRIVMHFSPSLMAGKTRSKHNMWKLRVSTNTALLRKKLLKKSAVEVLSPIHQRFEHKYVSGIYN